MGALTTFFGLNLNGILAAAFWSTAILNPENFLLKDLSIKNSNQVRSFSVSHVYFENEMIGSEIVFSEIEDYSIGTFQPVSIVSLTENKGVWFGYGLYNSFNFNFFDLRFSFLPGFYLKGDEVDLGGWIMFRSGVEIMLDVDEKHSLSFGFDHRSSGDIWKYNPGMETVFLSFQKKI